MAKSVLLATVMLALTGSMVRAQEDPITVDMSWSNFQQERWTTGEAAIVEALEAAVTYAAPFGRARP